MGLSRALKVIAKNCDVPKDIILGKYPSFVYRNMLADDELPVFCFHSAEPKTFETILEFLQTNRCHTLSTDELYDVLTNRKSSKPENSILLTFDDGMGSLWSVAYPLLKKYGFRATAFVVPGMIEEGGTYYPNLEDVWAGKAKIEAVVKRELSANPLCTWDEIRTMQNSGVVDFHSHTLDHTLIFTSPTIVDFVTPSSLTKFHVFEFAIFRGHDTTDTGYKMQRLGTPMYTSAPKMSGALRYIDDLGLTETCIDYVEKNGGESFFEYKNWKKTLRRVVKDYRKNQPSRQRYQTKVEQHRDIFFDLSESKKKIEKHLAGKTVKHLCYPWGVGSELSASLSRKVGYETNFWGKADNRLTNKVGDDPYRISRIGENFLYLLPGSGRTSLKKVILKKIKKTLKYGSPYLSH